MNAGHGPAPEPVAGHAGGRHRWRLVTSFAVVAAFFVVELIAGVVSGSLALLSDAGHMAADVVTLGAAMVATRLATRRDRSGRRSYGSYRAEVFASLLAVVVMLAVSGYVVAAAIARIGAAVDVDVDTGMMLSIGLLGLVVNLLALALLRGGAKESLNVKGAYLEVLADAAGSVGVIAAAWLVGATGSPAWDTGIALAIGVFVAVRAVLLGREVLAVLGQHVPAGLGLAVVSRELEAVSGVCGVHDLHLWTLTSGMNVATAHLVTTDGADAHAVLDGARELLQNRHGIAHATLQVEPRSHRGCDEVGW